MQLFLFAIGSFIQEVSYIIIVKKLNEFKLKLKYTLPSSFHPSCCVNAKFTWNLASLISPYFIFMQPEKFKGLILSP